MPDHDLPDDLLERVDECIQTGYKNRHRRIDEDRTAEAVLRIVFDHYFSSFRMLPPTRDLGAILDSLFNEARCGNNIIMQPTSSDELSSHVFDLNDKIEKLENLLDESMRAKYVRSVTENKEYKHEYPRG